MIEPRHPALPVSRQCALVGISRSAFYGPAKGESPLNLALMRLIDAQFLETPWYGSRQMARHLRREGHVVGRKRIRRLMRRMGLTAVYQKPRTTVPHPEHRTWPYLLRNLVIDRPDHVWCADITYIPMRRARHCPRTNGGSMARPPPGRHHGLGEPARAGLEAVEQSGMRPPSVRGPCRTDADFCIEALEGEPRCAPTVRAPRRTMARHGKPEIFNTDQGSQFTSPRFTEVLTGAGVKVSMDGKGRWMDNVFIERLWRSLKYECIYLHAFETGSETRAGIGKWMTYYNSERPHSALDGRTPLEAHAGDRGLDLAA